MLTETQISVKSWVLWSVPVAKDHLLVLFVWATGGIGQKIKFRSCMIWCKIFLPKCQLKSAALLSWRLFLFLAVLQNFLSYLKRNFVFKHFCKLATHLILRGTAELFCVVHMLPLHSSVGREQIPTVAFFCSLASWNNFELPYEKGTQRDSLWEKNGKINSYVLTLGLVKWWYSLVFEVAVSFYVLIKRKKNPTILGNCSRKLFSKVLLLVPILWTAFFPP